MNSAVPLPGKSNDPPGCVAERSVMVSNPGSMDRIGESGVSVSGSVDTEVKPAGIH